MMRKFKDHFGQIWKINNPIVIDKGPVDKIKLNL